MQDSTHDDRQVSTENRFNEPVDECECANCGVYSPENEVPMGPCPDAPGAGNWEHDWQSVGTDGGQVQTRRERVAITTAPPYDPHARVISTDQVEELLAALERYGPELEGVVLDVDADALDVLPDRWRVEVVEGAVDVP